MSLRRACTTAGLIVAVAMVSRTAAAAYWTNWVSSGPWGAPGAYVYCNAWDEAARGVGCSGTHCSSMRVECEQMPNGISLDPATDYWTDFFSEYTDGSETVWSGGGWGMWYDMSNFEICEKYLQSGAMSGVRCSGTECGSISLECTLPRYPNGTPAVYAGCYWSIYYSSTYGGSVDFGANNYVAGAWCQGTHCDSISYFVCHF